MKSYYLGLALMIAGLAIGGWLVADPPSLLELFPALIVAAGLFVTGLTLLNR